MYHSAVCWLVLFFVVAEVTADESLPDESVVAAPPMTGSSQPPTAAEWPGFLGPDRNGK